MLDDLAVLDAENVDDRAAGRAVPARRVHVQHDEITFGDDALDLAALIRKAHLEKIDERSQTLGAVGGRRIVLLVLPAEIRRCRREVLTIDGGVVELPRNALVRFELRGLRRRA